MSTPPQTCDPGCGLNATLRIIPGKWTIPLCTWGTENMAEMTTIAAERDESL